MEEIYVEAASAESPTNKGGRYCWSYCGYCGGIGGNYQFNRYYNGNSWY